MLKIDGIKVKTRVVSNNQLASIWKTLTKDQFPKVKAFKLADTDFNYVLRVRRCRDDDFREMEEWGRIIPARGTDACVFNADGFGDVDYVILVRKNPYHTLEEILKHELSHISHGDL